MPASGTRQRLERLAERLAGLGERPVSNDRGLVPTGWKRVDDRLGERGFRPSDARGLAWPGIHEWFGTCEGEPGRKAWSPPLSILTHLAWQALEAREPDLGDARVLWIGSGVWPYPRALVGDLFVRTMDRPAEVPSDRLKATGGDGLSAEPLELVRVETDAARVEPRELLARSIFVDVSEPGQRLWAIDKALRCASVVAVVADGSAFDMAASRRLQLAAEAGSGLGLLARPPWEESRLSAATTRWRVERKRSESAARPAWSLVLRRSKNAIHRGGLGVATCLAFSP